MKHAELDRMKKHWNALPTGLVHVIATNLRAGERCLAFWKEPEEHGVYPSASEKYECCESFATAKEDKGTVLVLPPPPTRVSLMIIKCSQKGISHPCRTSVMTASLPHLSRAFQESIQCCLRSYLLSCLLAKLASTKTRMSSLQRKSSV